MIVLLNSCGGHTCDAYRESDFTKYKSEKKSVSVTVIKKAINRLSVK